MKILSVKNVTKSFGKHMVLDDVSLEIDKPKILALVAPNGAGKSTLLNIIANIINANSGTVEVLGQSNKNHKIFNNFSYMIDNSILYPYLTGLDHIKFVSETHKLPKTAVREVSDFIGITHFLTKKTRDYSLGMKQQLLFAMSIINKPDLLILDEPFNGLDPSNIIKIRDIIYDYNQKDGKTVMLSSHNLSQIDMITDEVVFIKDGKLLEENIGNLQQNFINITMDRPLEPTIAKRIREYGIEVDDSNVILNQDKFDMPSVISELSKAGKIVHIKSEQRGSEERYRQLYPNV